jgi:hypothetical protein
VGTSERGNRVTLSGRFFAATVVAGRLSVRGVPKLGPWDASKLEWASEPEIDPCLVAEAGDRKVRTIEELREVIGWTKAGAATRFVWIHESLRDEVHRLWEDPDARSPS